MGDLGQIQSLLLALKRCQVTAQILIEMQKSSKCKD